MSVNNNIIFLYPCDYFEKHRADDMFEMERQIVEEMSAPYVLFDFDTFEFTSPLPYEDEASERIAVYRGWQVSPQQYADNILPLLCRIGIPLTDEQQYAACHTADGYLPLVGDLMLPSVEIDYASAMEDNDALECIAEQLETYDAFVKDGVKSVYGLNCIDLSDKGGTRDIFQSIVDSRDEMFSGTFVLKPWVEISEQARFFVLDGQIVLGVPHDGVWNGEYPDMISTSLPSRFYTVDMGRNKATGEWFVVECGDGQVSDAGDVDAMRKLYQALCAL